MNVEIGAEADLFPEKEYINGIFVAVRALLLRRTSGFSRKTEEKFQSRNRPSPLCVYSVVTGYYMRK